MERAGAVGSRLNTLAHFEEWVHLLLGAHLVAEDAVSSQVVWLMDV